MTYYTRRRNQIWLQENTRDSWFWFGSQIWYYDWSSLIWAL